MECRNAVDHFHFTSQLQRSQDTGQRMVLAEIMWGVVLADGMIPENEHYFARKISPTCSSWSLATSRRRLLPQLDRVVSTSTHGIEDIGVWKRYRSGFS